MSLTQVSPAAAAQTDHDALRDWFAGQALVGIIPTPRAPGVLPLDVDGIAEVAYRYADAMLRARGR